MISKERIDKALNRFHFYSGISWDCLPASEQEDLKKHTKSVSIKKKSILYRQGSYPNGIYFLKKGKLKVYQLNYDASIQILFIFSPGEIFGYRPILSNEYQPVTIAALEDCDLDFIERGYFTELLGKSITLSNQLLVSLSHEFTVLTNRMNVFAQRVIKERLALALLILNEKYKIKGQVSEIAEIKLSRTDLANFVGTSAENLSRTLNFFKEKKLIRIKGTSIFIENMENIFILSAIE